MSNTTPEPTAPDAAAKTAEPHSGNMSVSMTVNGQVCTIMVDPRITLLDALREELALTGTKKGCDRGECGACTVHVDRRRVLSCMTLAAMQEGKRITTIEGLERDGKLHPVQVAFIEHDGFMLKSRRDSCTNWNCSCSRLRPPRPCFATVGAPGSARRPHVAT
jgi:xanthine dehydrogenase YagT iron-sulfur-binding subunit